MEVSQEQVKGASLGTSRNQNTSNNNKSGNKNTVTTKENKNYNGLSGSKYIGSEKHLAVLGIKNNNHKTNNFLVFQCSVKNHVLTKFEYSGDIAYLVQELYREPMPPKLMKKCCH